MAAHNTTRFECGSIGGWNVARLDGRTQGGRAGWRHGSEVGVEVNVGMAA